MNPVRNERPQSWARNHEPQAGGNSMKSSIKIGFAPTRRAIFSAPAAVRFADLTRKKLDALGIDYVDIRDVNEEGLLFDDAGREKIAAKFKEAEIDGLFLAHENRSWAFRSFSGDPGMRDRTNRAEESATPSAACLQPARSFAASMSRLPISRTAILTIPSLPAA